LIGAPREKVELLAFDADTERLLPRVAVELDERGEGLAFIRRE
jgi:hypothetical protein